MITVADSTRAELAQASAALRDASPKLRVRMFEATARELGPVWSQAVSAMATTGLNRALLMAGAKIKPGDPPIAQAAQSDSPISAKSTLIPAQHYYVGEFGGTPHQTTYQRRSSSGNQHSVTAWVSLPSQISRRKATGWAVYPAFVAIAPRMVSLWVQLAMHMIHDALEGKTNG